MEKVPFESTQEGGAGLSQMSILESRVAGHGDNQCQGPVAAPHQACQRDNREASEADLK